MDSQYNAKLKSRDFARKSISIAVLVFVVLWCLGAFVFTGELRHVNDYMIPLAFLVWAYIVVTGFYLHNAKCPN